MNEIAQHELYAEHDSKPNSVEKLGARAAAHEILNAVLINKQALDAALEDNGTLKRIAGRDRAFARMMVATSLRRLGQIDDLIDKALERPEELKNERVRNILRLGVCQLMFMDVPDHAAVDTSVRLAEANGMEGQKGFINGVLRTMTRAGKEWLARQDETRLNTPEWLLKIWIADYGLRTAAEIAQANLSEAPLDISVKDPASKLSWASTLKATELRTGTLRKIDGGVVHEMPGFDEGMWWVQDAAAALPAKLFGDLKDAHVVDMCAAPGGKTMQMAAMGAYVTAIDRSAQRLKRVEQNLKRLRLEEQVKIEAADAAVWKPKDAPQRILLDAPCSATGTVRRHPDVPYLKTPGDLMRLAETQSRILKHAADILDVGGVLIYCTCSLQKLEGEEQIDMLLKAMPNMRRIGITPEEVGGYEDIINEHGDLRIMPFHLAAQGGMDGFFVSRLTKVS